MRRQQRYVICIYVRVGVVVGANAYITSVHHRRGKDGQDGRVGVQEIAVLEHSFVLLDAHVERRVVVFGPAAERM